MRETFSMRLAFILLALIVSPAINAENSPFMAALEIQLSDNQQLPLANKISFELLSSNPSGVAKRLAAWDNINVELVADDRLQLSMLSQQPAYLGDIKPQYSQDSFVIDFQEASTKQFIEAFQSPDESALLPQQITTFVSDYIEETTYVHSFNIASVVAQQRSGDCTEHAVLTTALARAQGLPSRVIIGTVILDEGNKISAYGHAWSEVWYQEKWQIIDAALYGSEAKKHFYLPAAPLDKESPGFAMSLMTATTLMPQAINNVKNVTL